MSIKTVNALRKIANALDNHIRYMKQQEYDRKMKEEERRILAGRADALRRAQLAKEYHTDSDQPASIEFWPQFTAKFKALFSGNVPEMYKIGPAERNLQYLKNRAELDKRQLAVLEWRYKNKKEAADEARRKDQEAAAGERGVAAGTHIRLGVGKDGRMRYGVKLRPTPVTPATPPVNTATDTVQSPAVQSQQATTTQQPSTRQPSAQPTTVSQSTVAYKTKR